MTHVGDIKASGGTPACHYLNYRDKIHKVFPKEIATFPDTTIDAYRVNSSVLVEILEKRMGGPVVRIRDLKTGKVREMYEYGGKKSCLLSVQSHISGEILLLHDYIKKELYWVNVDKALGDSAYCPKSRKVYLETQYIIPWKRNSILFLNPSSLNIGEKRFLTSRWPYYHKPSASDAMRNFNITHGFLYHDQLHDRVCYADQHIGMIEFWRNSTKTVILLDTGDPPAYSEMKNGSRIFRGGIPYSFISGAASNDRIALLFDPCKMIRGVKTGYQLDYPIVLIFDWDGNLLVSMEIDCEARPNSVSISKDGHVSVTACGTGQIHVFDCSF